MVNKERETNHCRSERRLQTRPSLAILPRHHHPLQLRLRIIAAPSIVEQRDPKTRSGVAVRATQPKLQIEDKRIRRQAMPPLQIPLVILDAAPARTAPRLFHAGPGLARIRLCRSLMREGQQWVHLSVLARGAVHFGLARAP
jgi:hypothetical protein